MRRLLAGIACAFVAACSTSSSRDRSLYEGPDSATTVQDPGAQNVKAEVQSLPFKHVEWEYKLTRHQIRRMTLSGSHLYVETPTHEVIAIDRFAGEVKWIYKIDTDTPLDFPPIAAHRVPQQIRALEQELVQINHDIEAIIKERGPCKESQEKQRERNEKRESLKIAQFGDNCYFLSRQVLYCLDRESGVLRWTKRLNFVPSAQPFATQFYVFVPAMDFSRVYALSVKDRGETIDYFRADVEADGSHITARAIYEDPVLYFCSHDGKIYSYSVRDRKRGNPYQTLGPILADPVIHYYSRLVQEADDKESTKKREVNRDTKVLVVGGTDNAFYCLEAGSGELLWRYECAGQIKTSAICKDATIYVKTEDGALFALNTLPLHKPAEIGKPLEWKRNGDLRWKVPLAERFLLKGKNYVYILGPRREIYAMNEITGDLAGRYKTRWLEFLVTNTGDDFFYCANSGGHIFALKESKENY